MISRSKPLKRTNIKPKQVRRSWEEALDKVEEEGRCRVCLVSAGGVVDGCMVQLEAAHVMGRKYDEPEYGPRGGKTLVVKRESVVPLCRDCHRQYDERRLDLLPFLFLPEQIEAVRVAGGIFAANKRIAGRD